LHIQIRKFPLPNLVGPVSLTTTFVFFNTKMNNEQCIAAGNTIGDQESSSAPFREYDLQRRNMLTKHQAELQQFELRKKLMKQRHAAEREQFRLAKNKYKSIHTTPVHVCSPIRKHKNNQSPRTHLIWKNLEELTRTPPLHTGL